MSTMRQDHDQLEEVFAAASAGAAAFHRGLAERPVAADYTARLTQTETLPKNGIGALAALKRFETEIAPNLSGSVGPRYLGLVTGGATPAALVGDWLAASVDQNLALPGDSAATPVTLRTLDFLKDLFGLPREAFEGSFTTGATGATLLGLATAREWCAEKVGLSAAEVGMRGLPVIPVLSACPHAATIKVMSITGFGRDALVPVGRLPNSEAMDPAALNMALGEQPAGPKIVVASAGTVTMTDFDDLNAVADLCARHEAWLHVDAAFGAFARCVPELAGMAAGLERADSITGDCHKWLNVPYDSGFFFTRRGDLLERAQGLAAAYLVTGATEPPMMSRAVESSQRFRALPAWMTLIAYGRQGVEEVVRANCAQATKLAAWIEEAPGFELLCPTRLNVVVPSVAEEDGTPSSPERNGALLAALARGGKVFATPGAVGERAGIRMCFSNWMTEDADLPIIFEALAKARAEIGELGEPPKQGTG